MKPGLLCFLLLLSSCRIPVPDDPDVYEYELTWYCISPEGCERTEELEQIDHVTEKDYDYYFTSKQDESFSEAAYRLASDTLPPECYWLYYLTFFGHELEPSKLCYNPVGFELELSIPNQEPTTHSRWVVSARDLALQ